jgi:hypothetical protein
MASNALPSFAARPPGKQHAIPDRRQANLAAKSEWEAASAAAAASPPPTLHALPPPCGCPVPPWEHCLHTRPALDDADALPDVQRTDDESLSLPTGRSAMFRSRQA